MNAISTTPIDRPGLYMTRNGKHVRIDCIDRETNSSFKCSGHILKFDKIGRMRRVWNIWHSSGKKGGLPGSGLDIVGYIGA